MLRSSKIPGVVQTVPEGWSGLLRQIDVAAHVRVFKADFSLFSGWNFLPVLVQKKDFITAFRTADRGIFIAFVDQEVTDTESGLAHGVHVVDFQPVQPDPVRRLRAGQAFSCQVIPVLSVYL